MKSLRKLLPGSPAVLRNRALLAAALTLLVLLPLWYAGCRWYQIDLVRQARAKAAEQIAVQANALTSAVNQRIALLQGLYAFTRTEWPDTQFDLPFEIYASGIYFNATGVRTLTIAPEGVARYIFPLFDAQVLSGYDLLHDPDLEMRADIQRAIHNREITLSRPGALRQGGFGLTAWQAVYRGQDLWGMVSIALDLHAVLADAGMNEQAAGLEIALRDRAGETFFGPPGVWQRGPVIQKITLPEGAWELGGVPQGGWDASVGFQLGLFRLSSLAIVGLVSGMVYQAVIRRSQLEQAVALRTRQITAAQQALEQRVQERTRELSALLHISRRISSTLALDPLLGQILVEVREALDYTIANISCLDECGNMLLLSEGGLHPHAQPFSLLDAVLVQQVLASHLPIIQGHWNTGGEDPQEMCWMGIPLIVKDNAIGLFILAHQDAQYYCEADANLAQAFAQQIAIAIENTRLYAQAGQLAVLEERQRLARELHDSVSQVLYSIGLGARTARAALQRNPDLIADALDYVNRLAEAGQVEMRALIFELRPESLQMEGLVAALERQAAVLRTRHQFAVLLTLCPEPAIPLAIKEALYRISQEAIHNVIKHSQASQVILSLNCLEKEISLEICDNGIGFDTSANFPGHLGLTSMQERAAQNQGRIQIKSSPGGGTKILVAFPIEI